MKSKIKNQTGMSMIEVLVTIVITSVALLGLAALLTKSMQSTFDASQRTTAVWAANDFVERYRMGIQVDNSRSALMDIRSQILIDHSLGSKLAGQDIDTRTPGSVEIVWDCTSCKKDPSNPNINQQKIKLLLN
ncbi:type IV pilus modification protein PilV [Zooshikella sp. RANM57]|uniref:type IV pilus modification protein PilV n=1 Tax=Zooshikella sp. RANM57 TaxID=3425863 RepID=UPI003D6EB859